MTMEIQNILMHNENIWDSAIAVLREECVSLKYIRKKVEPYLSFHFKNGKLSTQRNKQSTCFRPRFTLPPETNDKTAWPSPRAFSDLRGLMKSEDVLDITSDECGSPCSHTAAYPLSP